MRNLFDQYSQPENRLSHALAVCLHEDRALLRGFLLWVGVKAPATAKSLFLVEQSLPGNTPETEVKAEQKGLPDIVIHDDDTLVPAGVAVDAREALVRDRAPNSARLAQFPRMAPYVLPKRTRARVARAIEPGAWRTRRPAPRRSSAASHPGDNARAGNQHRAGHEITEQYRVNNLIPASVKDKMFPAPVERTRTLKDAEGV